MESKEICEKWRFSYEWKQFYSMRSDRGPNAYSVTGKLFAVSQTSCLIQVIYSSSGHLVESEVQNEAHCSHEVNSNDCVYVCMGLHVCLHENLLGLFPVYVLRCLQSFWTAAKQIQDQSRGFFHQFTLRNKNNNNNNCFHERRHRCSALKNKGIGRDIPLTDWPVSKYLADCWWTKSQNTSSERQWEFCLAFPLAVIRGCPTVFSLAGLEEKRLALPLPDSGSKMGRNVQWLFIPQV